MKSDPSRDVRTIALSGMLSFGKRLDIDSISPMSANDGKDIPKKYLNH